MAQQYSIFMPDKEIILSLLSEFANPEKMASFFVKNATSDFLFIRPSGNPISAKGFEEMMNSGDVVQEKAEITKIHKFEFLSSDVAMCVFTLGAKFSYKGTANDDLCQLSPPSSKRLMGFGKYIGCKDLQEIQICHYGISYFALEIGSQSKILEN